MKHALLTISLFLGSATGALCDTASDAAFVVDAHLRSNDTEAELTALSSKTVAALIPGLEKMGANVLDTDRFRDALLGDFNTEFMGLVRRRAIIAYREFLTPDEIADLAAFYRTEDGRVLIEDGLTRETLQASLAFLKDGPGAPMFRHWPEIDARIEEHVQEYAITELTERLSLDRIADILAQEHLVAFEVESRRREVVRALRGAD